MKTFALRLHQFGSADSALKYEEVELPELLPNEARMEMKAAPINPADLNTIEGMYPLQSEPPVIIGHEGIGVIVEVGSQVKNVSVGDHAIVYGGPGAWCRVRQVDSARVVPVPKEIPFEQAAMLTVNPPTAWLMLQQFVLLKAGDWIVQNAANSVVGRWVIHICARYEINTMNVVRREELFEPLKQDGATEVITDQDRFNKTIKEKIANDEMKLALNAVGGQNASELAKSLSPGGIHVTYGAMGKEPLQMSNALLIFQDIQFRGFWLTRWYKQADYSDVKQMFDEITEILLRRKIEIPIAKTYGLEEYQKAVEHAGQGARGGKVMFRMGL